MGFTSLFYIKDPSYYILHKNVLGALAYAIFVQTIFGYCCVSWANKHAPASLIAVYNSLQSLVTVILAKIFFNELFVWNEGAGTALVITGLVFVTYARIKESKDSSNSDNNKQSIENSSYNNEKDGLLSDNTINTYTDTDSKKWVISANNSR